MTWTRTKRARRVKLGRREAARVLPIAIATASGADPLAVARAEGTEKRAACTVLPHLALADTRAVWSLILTAPNRRGFEASCACATMALHFWGVAVWAFASAASRAPGC